MSHTNFLLYGLLWYYSTVLHFICFCCSQLDVTFLHSAITLNVVMGATLPEASVNVTALGDKYVLRDAKGQGAYGTVFLVQSPKTHRQYAAKIEPITVSLDEEISFIKEFDHPSILPVIDFHTAQDGLSWYVMPLVPSSLQRCLEKGGLGPDAQCGLFTQILSALAYIHLKDIIHCDIKPNNILVNPSNNHFYLIDFGMALCLPVHTKKRYVTCCKVIAFALYFWLTDFHSSKLFFLFHLSCWFRLCPAVSVCVMQYAS